MPAADEQGGEFLSLTTFRCSLIRPGSSRLGEASHTDTSARPDVLHIGLKFRRKFNILRPLLRIPSCPKTWNFHASPKLLYRPTRIPTSASDAAQIETY